VTNPDPKLQDDPRPSLWSPLRHPVFRALWFAGLASDFGAWTHEVGEGWLMTSLSPTPLHVALLQSADSLAIFLLAIPAGALADVVDRRRLAIWTQAWMLITASLLGALTFAHRMTPELLIALTFVMGVGAAVDGPLWQAIVPEVVSRRDLPQAVTLGGLSLNLARAFAPALGGVVIALSGPFAVFLLNAATFAYVLVVLFRWHRVAPRASAPGERWIGAMRGGLRYVRNSPELVAAFVRAGATLFGAICLMALLPLFARRELGLGSLGFGVVLGCMGIGAVLSALVLPKAKLSAEAALSAGTVGFAAAVCGLAVAHAPWLACGVMVFAGFAWMAIMSSLNVAVQIGTPAWVRARVLAAFMLVFQGAIALGGVVWGAVATRTSLRASLLAGGAVMFASLAARIWFPLSGRSPNFSPAAWPKPALVCDPPTDAGPVLVTVSYRVAPENLARFVEEARALERLRRRSGAYQWELFRDPSTPDVYLEVYYVELWADHLRQHERATVEEDEVEKKLRALVVTGTEPDVDHFVAVSSDDTEPDASSERGGATTR
jgi:MFS family permease